MNHKYRKKPIVIEAYQMTKERRMDNSTWPEWLNEAWNKDRAQVGAVFSNAEGMLRVNTLEGTCYDVAWNDYIIRGVNFELYPCKPDVFEKSYEPAE